MAKFEVTVNEGARASDVQTPKRAVKTRTVMLVDVYGCELHAVPFNQVKAGERFRLYEYDGRPVDNYAVSAALGPAEAVQGLVAIKSTPYQLELIPTGTAVFVTRGGHRGRRGVVVGVSDTLVNSSQAYVVRLDGQAETCVHSPWELSVIKAP
jgi:hypothetical protein